MKNGQLESNLQYGSDFLGYIYSPRKNIIWYNADNVFDIYRGGNKMANIYEIRNNIKVTEEKLERLYPQNNRESEIENLEEYLYGLRKELRSLEMA